MKRLPPSSLFFTACLAAGLSIVLSVPAVRAAPPRALPEGKQPDDSRLSPLKDLDGYFPFEPPQTEADWAKRREQVQRRLKVALGVWPMPTKTPLNAVIHSSVEKDDYTVERVYFESMPGFFVTGSLYRPKNGEGPFPGVLCPHGHWANGRFHDAGEGAAKAAVSSGAEKDEEAARSPLQARCVHLARMGCVVFHYDMIGYADSQQISFEVAHRFAKQRPEMNRAENWGLYSPQAESHVQSVMGLQTIISIRALDFLAALPDVDEKRLAVTGASGGGTQTFILAGIDPRPAVAVPAVMVSTAMQGGCTCENAALLRVGTGNVEIAGLFAPKPLGLTAADDWTREMETKGYPQLRELYQRLGAADNVALWANTQFGHNYNLVSRLAMYGWMNEHLDLGQKAPIEERPFERLSTEEMTVWTDSHPKPPGGDEFERKLLAWWTEDSQTQLDALQPQDEKSLREFREVVGGGVDVVIGRDLPQGADLEKENIEKTQRDGYLEIVCLVRNVKHGEELPAVFLHPENWNGQAVLWIDERGKAGLYQDDGSPNPHVQKLLDDGAAVGGVDLLYQGEFLADGQPVAQTRRVKNPREAAAYTFGYNPALFARRVHDVLTMVAFIRNHDLAPKSVDVVGLGKAGPWVAAARAQARDAIDRAVVDTGGFRFAGVTDIHSPEFLPGGAKYFDLPGMLAVGAPAELWLAGEGEQAPEIIRAAYRAAKGEDAVHVYAGETDKAAEAAVSWLLEGK
jgi:dienelactone hydrolase